MKNSSPLIDPILFAKHENLDFSQFYDLSNFLTEKTDNYYFQSSKSKIDVEQFNGIKIEVQNKLKIIRFQTSNHGFPFLRINLKNVLAFSKDELKYSKMI